MTERQLVINPAWDKRSEGYGQHSVEMRWYVKGPKGAIQFVVFTGWSLAISPAPSEQWNEWERRDRNEKAFHEPMAADIGYHSPVPMYEGQEAMDNECHVIGGKCYYDGSGLNAEHFFAVLVHKGGDALWEELEKEYSRRFSEVAA